MLQGQDNSLTSGMWAKCSCADHIINLADTFKLPYNLQKLKLADVSFLSHLCIYSIPYRSSISGLRHKLFPWSSNRRTYVAKKFVKT